MCGKDLLNAHTAPATLICKGTKPIEIIGFCKMTQKPAHNLMYRRADLKRDSKCRCGFCVLMSEQREMEGR